MAPKTKESNPIRVGVVGVGRGLSMGGSNSTSGLQLVELCDT